MRVRAVTFSGGGEPFCYPHLLEVVKRLSQSKVKFAALTNGSLLKGEVAEVFANYAQWLRISIDGWDDESYSAYREVPKDEFTKILTNIRNFKKYKGNCYLGVCIVADKKNAPHIYELMKKLKESGVNSIKVAPCIVSNDGRENNEYHKPVFEAIKTQIARAISEFAGEKLEILDSYNGQLETFEKEYTWCPYMQINPVIGADLNVYACHDKAYNIEEGMMCSIKEQRFKDAWFLDKSNFFKINPMIHCRHHCMVNEKNKMILEYLDVDREHLFFV